MRKAAGIGTAMGIGPGPRTATEVEVLADAGDGGAAGEAGLSRVDHFGERVGTMDEGPLDMPAHHGASRRSIDNLLTGDQ